jgi:glycosyltransferase involved in cell wall biosynthesis
MNVPVYIICYNNGFYVENTINQLKLKNIPNELIIIINNNSDDQTTIDILNQLSSLHKVINLEKNYGHRVWAESIIFDNLPEYFIVTDPDLEYNKELPDDFINTLYEISVLYSASKVGFALNIDAPDLFNDPYIEGMTIKEWESQFWKDPLPKYKNLDI